MKDPQLNPLSQRQRKLLQLGVVLMLLLFLAGYFFFFGKKNNNTQVKSTSITLKDSKLQVFDDTYTFNQFPDKIVMHYPYFLVVKPDQQKTIIYNLVEHKKEKETKEILLDYFKGDLLYSEGKVTYFNQQNLGILCEKGFIKSKEEILCIAKTDKDVVTNMLVLINTQTEKRKEIYRSQDLISALSVINNKVYLGEINLYNKKNYILINKERAEIPDVVSIIYEMKEKSYFASFKSALNKQKESYYIIDTQAQKVAEGEIVLYK